MEIAPGVHQVRLLGADTFLIAEPGQGVTLIDAGMIGARRAIERRLRAIGRSLDDVERIVCTHGHPDHIGGLHELVRDREHVSVLMHPADLAGLRLSLRQVMTRTDDGVARHNRMIAYMTRTPADAEPVEDGDVIPVLGGLRVVHTPGHTPGSICLYAERHRLLFTGDVLQVIRGRLTYASSLFSHDYAQACATIDRLAALDVETIALSHYPPWRRDPNRALRQLAARAAAS
ncbi:MAG: MBL fold metallo-hydrolase [Candidatus Limnocylindria bacterium]